MNPIDFTFSDTIAGYVTSATGDDFVIKTSDGREFAAKLTAATYAEMVRNLGEPFQDIGGPIQSLLTPGQHLFAYGVFFPEGGDNKFEAKHIVFSGKGDGDFRFETQDWWIKQIIQLAEFYLKAQFPDGVIDYKQYRTHLTLEGQKIDTTRQETDTISRMVYGFASAFLLTGDDRYLEVAEKGTEYLRDHLCARDEKEDYIYWYHATDVQNGRERKILASQFGDDYDAIPAYEQIYALAGPIQTYRATGDPRILKDAQMTINLFDRFFKDHEKGGYFSHVDPVMLDPRAESLTFDRARKNWNSVGDHAPAYLINLVLATGDKKYEDFLVDTADTIEKYFKDYDHSPFIQEKFHEDWSHDQTWGWQQNRSVVGHNLKIAWNLMRVHHLRPKDEYTAFARKIAEEMPKFGMDKQRHGWYDVMERVRGEGEEFHRYVWHDRKAWWQQEQGILAYLILAGSLGDAKYRTLSQESSAFYNAWFPDHDSGGVYFNVLANGVPYLLGTERLKGSHSMSGYHSFELCYLAATYTNLLVTKQPLDLYFKPQPGGFKDNILRVAPDILPPGSIKIEEVWINGQRHTDFDAEALTVTLPSGSGKSPEALQQRPNWSGNPNMLPTTTQQEMKVRVRLVPSSMTFDAVLDLSGKDAVLTLEGVLDDAAEPGFKAKLDEVLKAAPEKFVLHVEDLQSMSQASARALAFARQKMDFNTEVQIIGLQDGVKESLKSVDFLEEVTVLDA